MIKSGICIWLDHQAEEAAKFYQEVFPGSKVTLKSYYTNAGKDFHQREVGSLMTIDMEINGMAVQLLNGGPMFHPSEGLSLTVECDTQEEIDRYWEKLSAGGSPGHCGWLKDRFGVSWQVYPKVLMDLIAGEDRARAERVTDAFFKMSKFDIEALLKA